MVLSNPLSILVAVLYISPYFPSDFFDLHIQSSLRTISSPILKYNHIYIYIYKKDGCVTKQRRMVGEGQDTMCKIQVFELREFYF